MNSIPDKIMKSRREYYKRMFDEATSAGKDATDSAKESFMKRSRGGEYMLNANGVEGLERAVLKAARRTVKK